MTARGATVRTALGGWLGEAAAASRRGRLTRFITDEHSAPVALFEPAQADRHTAGDWYGEHAGKWLAAAAAAGAPHDARALHVARHLAGLQRDDGYLGTSAAGHRFTGPPAPRPPSWDGAPAQRTWDVWVHACLLGGLLAVHEQSGDASTLDAASRIGDLAWLTFVERGLDITECGNHHGLSASVLLEPVVRLFEATGEVRYRQLAERIVAQADARPELALVRRALAGADAAEIATGKAYQLLWMTAGLVRLYRASWPSAQPDLLAAALAIHRSVEGHHLSLGGGPWGGVGHRSREVFNAPGFFSPQGYVETCSTLAWIQLNRELLAATGEARFAECIEQSAYNDLLGAAAPNGEDWCYYSFANGRRVHTTAWRCCKSSGALALEELAPLAVQVAAGEAGPEVRVAMWGAAESVIDIAGGRRAVLRQETRYPADGAVRLTWAEAPGGELPLVLRIPSWARGASVRVNDEPAASAEPGGWHRLVRRWRSGDTITLHLPMRLAMHRREQRNVQESKAPDGQAVRQEVQREAYGAFTRGPLVYAAGLVDGYKTQETLKLRDGAVESWLRESAEAGPDGAPSLLLHPEHRGPIELVPSYRAGGREHGAWRTTWFSLAPDGTGPFTDEPPGAGL